MTSEGRVHNSVHVTVKATREVLALQADGAQVRELVIR